MKWIRKVLMIDEVKEVAPPKDPEKIGINRNYELSVWSKNKFRHPKKDEADA